MRRLLLKLIDYAWAGVAVVLATCARSKRDNDQDGYPF
jgi:hypothetical protein